MVDPTSDVGDVDPEEAPTCETCGERLVEAPNHLVVTWVEDGRAEHRHFCDEACREEWDAEERG
ncbi:MAG: hypothetical protein ABEH47_06010 [Haloferacaceae archaeon]